MTVGRDTERRGVEGSTALGARTADALVFVCAGAVLILEIVSLRLVAPYLGLTLETSSAVIGVALTAIAVGAWAGGRAADTGEPSAWLGPLVLAAAALFTVVAPVVRWTGDRVPAGDASVVLLIAGIAVFAPAALLSAVPPMVVKLRLATLAETGTVVGRVSAVGTVGAIGGTFLAGFVLVAQLRVTTVLLSLAALLAIVGAWLTWRLRRRPRDIAVPVVLALLGATLSLTAPQRCEAETAYHCATVWTDGNRPTGRVLELDNLRHSYVDLAEPRWVEFEYLRAIAAAVDVFRPSGASLRALHVGGGGYTLPRYLEATRPGSSSHVLEIDPGVTRLAQRRLDLVLGGGITAASQDGRVGLRREPSGSRDLVVGDAFGGVAVPWHLTTRESVREVARVVGEQGLYAVNVIDYQPLAFARSEVATIAAEFAHVAVVATPETLARAGGGNVVVLASQSPLPVEALRERLRSQVPSWDLLVGADAVRGFVAGAEVLTDDFAPVDQLLTPNPPPVAAG